MPMLVWIPLPTQAAFQLGSRNCKIAAGVKGVLHRRGRQTTGLMQPPWLLALTKSNRSETLVLCLLIDPSLHRVLVYLQC